MNFIKTKLARSTAGATLLVALLLSLPAFAAGPQGPTLMNNERAAQNTISYSPIYGDHVQSKRAAATLATNEDAAQHAIADRSADSEFANFRTNPVSGATDEVTLVHNELSARRAIGNAPASSLFSHTIRTSAALSPSTSNESAAAR